MDVIDELITHCEAWEPWARVMGNVCAGDAAQALRNLRAELAECQRLLHRYRNETPLGHQPHMIAHEVDTALAAKGDE